MTGSGWISQCHPAHPLCSMSLYRILDGVPPLCTLDGHLTIRKLGFGDLPRHMAFVKLDPEDIGALEVRNSGDDDKAFEDHGGGILVHNKLCNKTVIDIIDSVHSEGTRTLSSPQCTSPNKTSPGKFLLGHLDIHTMFPTMRVYTPNKIAAAKVMEDNMALQESEEGAHHDQVEALRMKFAVAAELN